MTDRTVAKNSDDNTKTINVDSEETILSKTILDTGGRSGKHPGLAQIGKVIENKFKLVRKIGEGGMGVVYEAEHLHLKKRFAIKSIRAEFTKYPDFNERFDREAKTQALLQHPNIIQVTDFIKEDGQFFLVMEYVDGEGLDKLISENRISEKQILSIFMDVLKGLGHAHSKGIVHRDIKPSNIMITEGNTAKLMDFGIAMLTGEGKADHKVMAGTPPYMSPEQIQAPGSIDHRSDIYSMGIVLFQMLTNKRPFDGRTDQETLMNHIHMKLPDIKPLADSYPELEDIVKQSLAKRPEDRFQDCKAYADRIQTYLRKTHIECRYCKFDNRVENKYKLKAEKCVKCGKPLSMKSRFTKVWATAFALAAALILAYFVYPWPGKLVVKTTPENALVFINGEQQGESPLTTSLAPGEYQVRIRKENHEEFSELVVIQKNEKTALDVRLQKPDELSKIAYEKMKDALQSASYVCRDLNDLIASKQNLEIAKSIGDSALTDSYQQQIKELTQNINGGLKKYTECFSELKTIKPEIRNPAYQDYVRALKAKGGNIDNLSVVWAHFAGYLKNGVQLEKWKAEIQKFC